MKISIFLLLIYVLVGVEKSEADCQSELKNRRFLTEYAIKGADELLIVDKSASFFTSFYYDDEKLEISALSLSPLKELIIVPDYYKNIKKRLCVYLPDINEANENNEPIDIIFSTSNSPELLEIALLAKEWESENFTDKTKSSYENLLKKLQSNKSQYISAFLFTYFNTLWSAAQFEKIMSAYEKLEKSLLSPDVSVHIGIIYVDAVLKLKKAALAESVSMDLLTNTMELQLYQRIHLIVLLSESLLSQNKLASGFAYLQEVEYLLKLESKKQYVPHRVLLEYYDNRAYYWLKKFYAEKHTSHLRTALIDEYKALHHSYFLADLTKNQQVMNNIAWIKRSLWMLESASETYSRSLALSIDNDNSFSRALSFRNLANLEYSLGNYQQAITYFLQVLPFSESSMPSWYTDSLCALGNAYRYLEDKHNANVYMALCLDSTRAFSTTYTSRLTALTDYYHSEIYPEEVREEVLGLLEKVPEPQDKIKAYLWLAKASLVANRLDDAADYFRKANVLSSGASDPVLKIQVSMEAATALLQRSQQQALPYIEQALDDIEKIRKELDPELLGPAWSQKVSDFYNRLIGQHLADSEFDIAFNLYESSLAASMRKVYAVKDITTDESRLTKISSIAAKMAVDGAQDSSLELSIEKRLLKLDKPGAIQSPVLQELMWYQNNKEKLQEVGPAELIPAQTLTEIQEKLVQGQIVLAYIELQQELGAFIVSHDSFIYRSLSDIKKHQDNLSGLQQKLRSPDQNPWPILKKMSSYLIPAEVSESTASEALIITSPSLSAFPFSAIPTKQGKLLINELKLKQIPSTTSHFLPRTDIKRDALDLAIFSSPITTHVASSEQEQQNWANKLPRLEWSKYEANGLKDIYRDKNTMQFLQEQANRQQLLSQNVREARILHIATHSYFNPNQPTNVGFTLSLWNEGSYDPGFVTFSELYSHSFQNDLVVINGCESGLGNTFRSEGMQGMARGFLVSGVNNVIATLWPISDKVSAEFMLSFYRHLGDSKDYAKALQQTQIEFASNPRYRHPFYWAAYTHYAR
ncbi:CHAT domain-containing protein [Bowmanella denitrificans]|uniref:CHAT domain-containing protein n=1 Tax=Bowmanella denitrificans TaxID=366582 RepID=UPI001558972A|nr:CHAT domain-containing tetratricopeptide repeat protein [Bowmanella denitrificans]